MPDVLWEEDYLLDLTKPYHNLLGLQKNGESQTFYYDNNVTAMEENGHFHYYLQDELGSPFVSVTGSLRRIEPLTAGTT